MRFPPQSPLAFISVHWRLHDKLSHHGESRRLGANRNPSASAGESEIYHIAHIDRPESFGQGGLYPTPSWRNGAS